jgi:hypothetical protein
MCCLRMTAKPSATQLTARTKSAKVTALAARHSKRPVVGAGPSRFTEVIGAARGRALGSPP